MFAGPYEVKTVNYGGIIIAAKLFTPTAEILYSVDNGDAWKTYQLNEAVSIVHLDTSLIPNNDRMLLLGLYYENPNGEGSELLTIDFGKLARLRSCSDYESVFKIDSDFELVTVQQCLMGQRTTVLQKKRDYECLLLEGQKTVSYFDQPCLCTENDYECDVGYSYIEEGTCQPREHFIGELKKVHRECVFGEYFHLTSGYRKVPGNQCLGGVQKDLKRKIYCSEGVKDTTIIMLLMLTMLTLMCYMGFTCYNLCRDEHPEIFDNLNE